MLGYVCEQTLRDCSEKISGNKISIFLELGSKPNNSSICFLHVKKSVKGQKVVNSTSVVC